MLKEAVRNKIFYEGSHLDPTRKQTGNERSDSQSATEELWSSRALGGGGPKMAGFPVSV